MIFAFDVDGTLTPSRGKISAKMKKELLKFNKKNKSIIVTGSDQAKTIEQIGQEAYDSFYMAFQSCGNAVYQDGKLIHEFDIEVDRRMNSFFHDALTASSSPIKTSTFIEVRKGLVNFSFCGRDVTQEQREAYHKWDSKHLERRDFCVAFNDAFRNLEAAVGGEISVDIYARGKDKSQVRSWFTDEMVFIGDSVYPGGNDYTLAMLCEKWYNVKDPKETLEVLNDYS